MPNTKLSLLPTETTIALTDFLVKVKAASAGDVLVSLQNFLNSIGGSTYCPYKFNVYRAAAWTVLTTGTTVAFDTANFDTSSNVNLTTGVFTAPAAGFYLFNAGLRWTGGASTTTTNAFFQKNAASVNVIAITLTLGGANTIAVNGSTLLQLAQNDTVSVLATAGTANATGATGSSNTFFTGHLVSAT